MSSNPFAVAAAQDPAVRLRAAIELSLLVSLTAVFFIYRGATDIAIQLALALPFIGFIVVGAGQTRTRVWGLHETPDTVRRNRAIKTISAVTIPAVVACLGWAAVFDNRIANPTMLYAFALYLPWALAQEFIFQFYLLGRLRALLPHTMPVVVAMLNGLAYGLVHMPDARLMLATAFAGTFWSYSYMRDRHIVPIAVSHALLGVTFYYWVIGVDLFQVMATRFGG